MDGRGPAPPTATRKPELTAAMADKKETFPGRWSSLKRGGGAAPAIDPEGPLKMEPERRSAIVDDELAPSRAAAVPTDTTVQSDNTSEPQTGEPRTGEPVPELPDIDSLDAESDYTPFLGQNVPEKIARRALRKLWLSDASFGFRDGLDDYDENFRAYVTDAFAKTVKTAYQVAKSATSDDPETRRTSDYAHETDDQPEAEKKPTRWNRPIRNPPKAKIPTILHRYSRVFQGPDFTHLRPGRTVHDRDWDLPPGKISVIIKS